jgi:hypothetical protein
VRRVDLSALAYDALDVQTTEIGVKRKLDGHARQIWTRLKRDPDLGALAWLAPIVFLYESEMLRLIVLVVLSALALDLKTLSIFHDLPVD